VCGRYTLTSDAEEVVEAFDVPPLSFDHHPRYNIAPGQEAPVCARDVRGRRVGLMRWGLVPSWADEPRSGFINARGETVGRTRSFRDAFLRRRCLVPADGFFEWHRSAGGGVPYYFRAASDRLVSFAGIWERWARPDAEPRFGFAILTTAANEEVASVHDRMPVVIPPHERAIWIDPDAPPDRVGALIRTAPPGTFVPRRVSTKVNSPRLDDPSLLEAMEG
jgi:putative SOS response-associated peptidase YedK